jgi:hypothetical protein
MILKGGDDSDLLGWNNCHEKAGVLSHLML